MRRGPNPAAETAPSHWRDRASRRVPEDSEMRRASALAVIMVMALSGVALAKAPVAMVTGTYTYLVGERPGAVARRSPLNATGHGLPATGYLVLDDAGLDHRVAR